MDRNSIINNYDINEFMSFLQNDHEGKILELLNNDGLSLLNTSSKKEERITYILYYSKYTDELFKNEEFLKIFIESDITCYYASLRHLKDETYDHILDYVYNHEDDSYKLSMLFSYFSDSYKVNKIDNWKYGYNALYKIVNNDIPEVVNKIINNYNIDLSDPRLSISILVRNAKYSVLKDQESRNLNGKTIPTINISMNLLNKDLAKRLLNSYDVFEMRRILNDLAWSSNPDELNNYIKKIEDLFINSFDESKLLPSYQALFETYKDMKESLYGEKDNFHELRIKYREAQKHFKDIPYINEELDKVYNDGDINDVYDYLKKCQNRKMSNYIIDYHFEENYHNVLIDIKELLRYYYDGNIKLSKENVDIYEKIIKIDNLSLNEKKELHNNLKTINIKERFYDDMSFARHLVNSAIKNKAISSDTIAKYKDKELSKVYGVDVYNIDNEPFFGIVKTGNHDLDDLPTGHSYSLVGSSCVAVYGNVKNGQTYLFDSKDLNPDQIVHVFPYDSFTLFKPFNAVDEPTNRINTLLKPEDIADISPRAYSEILILEQGKIPTDIDKDIAKLRKLAIYCIDEITPEAINKAKEENLGIVLVKSRDFIDNEKYDDELYKNIKYAFHSNYFVDINDREEFESKR